MKNPILDGVILVETVRPVKGKKHGTECYDGPSRTSVPYKVKSKVFENGFNPKKIVFFGEEIIIYAKNMTLKFSVDGTVETLPVDKWDESNTGKIEKDIEMYGVKR